MKDHIHHKREIRFLLLLMIMFCIIFFIAFFDMKRDVAIMGVLPAKLEDAVIMTFSLLAILKVFWHLIKG